MTDLQPEPAETAAPRPLPSGHVIVCGLGRFGLRVVELLRAESVPVVVITDAVTRADRKRQARHVGAQVIEGDFRFDDIRALAHTTEARAMILATSSDGPNLECALDARREYPHLRVVMRLDTDKLSERLQSDFGIDAVLSPPALAAPEFARAALQAAPFPKTSPSTAKRHPQIASAQRAMRRLSPLDGRRQSRLLLLSLMLIFVAAVLLFHGSLRLSWVDAVYFTATIVTTVGFGDFNLQRETAGVKLFGVLLMFSGVTLIAVLSSMLTNFLLSGAAIQLRAERMASRLRGQVILCGLGSVGFEVARDLAARRIPVVVIDATPDDLHARLLSTRIPILVGDATNADVLLRAGLGRARAVVVVTSDDAINLEIGLTAQSLVEETRPDRPLRLVLRCFDPDLANRIHAISEAYTLLSSAELAAPIFVRKALENS
ncbi:MAG: NAD-binding protein [Cytophagales bacterium]|nr:NAD-binding protein [Armatimonadota bacterium]